MTTRRILLVGSSGMLGRELLDEGRRRGHEIACLAGTAACDVVSRESVDHALRRVGRPDVILNAAAYTNVDGAESDEARATAVNGDGPGHLAAAAAELDALLVHFSTDYVFDGRARRPYRPDDPVAPAGAYGRSKLRGEEAIRDAEAEHLILRTAWLYAPHGKNFLRTMLSLFRVKNRLEVVTDQRGRPTACLDLARLAFDLVDAGARGTLHACNGGDGSWYEFAHAIARAVGADTRIEPTTTEFMPRPAPRPAYSVLDLDDAIDLVGPPRHWRDALASCVASMRLPAAATRPFRSTAFTPALAEFT